MSQFGEYFVMYQHTRETQRLGPDWGAKRTRLTVYTSRAKICTS
jgi:hypothetical protein